MIRTDHLCIALLYFMLMVKRRILWHRTDCSSQTVMSGESAAVPEVGNASLWQRSSVGTVIHNIELRPGQGAELVRAAGTFAQLTWRGYLCGD